MDKISVLYPLMSAECLLERGGYIRLLDVGGRSGYEEIRDRKGESITYKNPYRGCSFKPCRDLGLYYCKSQVITFDNYCIKYVFIITIKKALINQLQYRLSSRNPLCF